MNDLTLILKAASAGDPRAASELLPLVYDELRRLAAHRLAGERNGHTLQATALVQEAWLKISGDEQRDWNGRKHFFATAAEAMRRILVDPRWFLPGNRCCWRLAGYCRGFERG